MLKNLNELIIRPCQVPSKSEASCLDQKSESILMSSNFLPTSHHSSNNKIHPPQAQAYWWNIKRPRYPILIRLSWLIMRPNRCWSPMDIDYKFAVSAYTTVLYHHSFKHKIIDPNTRTRCLPTLTRRSLQFIFLQQHVETGFWGSPFFR